MTGRHVALGRGETPAPVTGSIPARSGIPARPTMRRTLLDPETRTLLDDLDHLAASAVLLGVTPGDWHAARRRLAEPADLARNRDAGRSLVALLTVGYDLDDAVAAVEWARAHAVDAHPEAEIVLMLARAAAAGHPLALDHENPG